jgi:DNA-binding LytR/AlgR family response regulator
VIIDDDPHRAQKTLATAEVFPFLTFLGMAKSFDDGVDLVLDQQPDFVLLEIDPDDTSSGLSLHFISELYRYLVQLPKIIITTKNDNLCLQAFKYGVFDYLIHPVETKELRKTFLRFEKESGVVVSKAPMVTAKVPVKIPIETTVEPEKKPIQKLELGEEVQEMLSNDVADVVSSGTVIMSDDSIENETVSVVKETPDSIQSNSQEQVVVSQNTPDKPLVICVKSYGDYRYIDASEICYLQADNNSTDIHLSSGEMITAFKTLKHFEGVLRHPFVRIHNSYIVNVDFIGRIHTGNSVCHIKNSTVKLPFSKSYKDNIEQIINSIASGNYLEI